MNPVKPRLLPPGNAPGFAKLKSEPGVFRCKLRPLTKTKPEHADYGGTLVLAGNTRASCLLWVHEDGSLGLRVALEKKDKRPS